MKQKPLVILDFDGTLAPIVSNPEKARIMAEDLASLRRVSKKAEIVILTGRPASFVKRRMPGLKIPVLGLHGNDTRAPSPSIDILKKRAIRLFGKARGVVEEKPLGFTLHYRNAPKLKRSLARFAKTAGKCIRVLEGRKAFEFLPASARTKPETLEMIVKRNPNRRVLSIGDDYSDLGGILRMQKYPNFTGALVKSREVRSKGTKTISRSELFSFIENFINGNSNEEKA